MKEKKYGFTLIELLAVIIILGVLMVIAIPSVTSYINSSRKNAYVITVSELSSSAKNLVNSGSLSVYDPNVTYYIPTSCLNLENGKAVSPYGDFVKSYIIVTYDMSNFDYYWTGVDESTHGSSLIIKVDDLKEEDILQDIKPDDISTNTALDGREYASIMDDSCSNFTSAPGIVEGYSFIDTNSFATSCTVGEEIPCNESNVNQSYIKSCAPTYGFTTTGTSSTRTSTVCGSGDSTSSFTCNGTNVGRTVNECQYTNNYSFTTSTTTSGSCTPSSGFTCNSTNSGRSYVTCSGGSFGFTTSTTSTSSCSSTSGFTCNSTNKGRSYVTCTKTSSATYGFTTSSYTSSSCSSTASISCNSSNVGKSYVSCLKTSDTSWNVTRHTCNKTGSDVYSKVTHTCNMTGSYSVHTYTCRKDTQGTKTITTRTCKSGYNVVKSTCKATS